MKVNKIQLLTAATILASGAMSANATVGTLDFTDPSLTTPFYGGYAPTQGHYYGNPANTIKAANDPTPDANFVVDSTLNLDSLAKGTVLRNFGAGPSVISKTVTPGIILPGYKYDLTTPADQPLPAPAAVPDAEVGYSVYGIYVQDYSAVVGNGIKGVNNEEIQRDKFIKAIKGTPFTAQDTIAAGDYTYSGKAFTNFGQGDFNYTIHANAGTVKGDGSALITGIKHDPRPAFKDSRLDIKVTLEKATAVNGKFKDKISVDQLDTGSAPAGTWAALADLSSVHGFDPNDPNTNYELQLYGPQGQEIAGTINGLPFRIGQVGLAGKTEGTPAPLQVIRVK